MSRSWTDLKPSHVSGAIFSSAMEKQIPCFYAPDFFWWLLRHGSDKKRIGKQFVTDPLRYFKMSERQCDIPDPSFLQYRLTDLRLLLL